MTIETPAPVDASRAAHEQWSQILAGERAKAEPAPTPQPNEKAIELIRATQTGINPETGKSYYSENAKFRQAVEKLYVQAFDGTFDTAAAKRAVAEALGRELPPEPSKVEPQGTPEQRATDAAWKPAADMTADELHGYQPFDLPGEVNAEVLADYLAPARAAEIGQDQMQKFLAGLSQHEAEQPDRSIAEYVPADKLSGDAWGGFQPVGLPAGLTIDREQFGAVMRSAKAAGVGQDQLERALAAYLERISESS